MDPLPFYTCLLRAREEANDFVLAGIRFPVRGDEHIAYRFAPGTVRVGRRCHPTEWLNDLLPVTIEYPFRNLLLTRQDLPDSDRCLKRTQGVTTNVMAGDV